MSTYLQRLDDYNRYACDGQMAKFAEIKNINGIDVETDPNVKMDNGEAVKRLYNLAGPKLQQHWADQGVQNNAFLFPYMMADLTNPKFREDAMPIYRHLGQNAQYDYTAKPGGPRSALLTNDLLSTVKSQYKDYMDEHWFERNAAKWRGWDPTGMIDKKMGEGIADKFNEVGRVGLSALQGGHGSGMIPMTKQEIAKRDAAMKQQQAAAQPAQGDYSQGIGRYAIPALGAGLPLALLAGLGGKSGWILPLLALLGLGGAGYGYARSQGWGGYQPVENLVDQFHGYLGGGAPAQTETTAAAPAK